MNCPHIHNFGSPIRFYPFSHNGFGSFEPKSLPQSKKTKIFT